MSREMQAWLAQAINAERAARGLSIRALALAAVVPERTLVRALKCERDLNVGQLAKLAHALGVLPSYLQAEAERRQSRATPGERARVIIESDESLSRAQKDALLGVQNPTDGDVESRMDDDGGTSGSHHHQG